MKNEKIKGRIPHCERRPFTMQNTAFRSAKGHVSPTRWLSAVCALMLGMLSYVPACGQERTGDNGDGTFSNPVLWLDVPDPDVIRVGSDYYMVNTTMHYAPGRP